MKKAFAGIAIGVLLFAGSVSFASAGEVTGNGDQTPIKTLRVAASNCSFSGLEDDVDEGNPPDVDVVPGVTQNWGQIVSGAGLSGPGTGVPGTGTGRETCNPTRE